jgi:hypothetical protein
MPDSPTWRLHDFEECVDARIELDDPTIELRTEVLAWLQSRMDDPYRGARRERGEDNFWYAVIPKTSHGDNKVVACSYWIRESDRVVQCGMISALSQPI